MTNSKSSKDSKAKVPNNEDKATSTKKPYVFGDIKEISLEHIEEEILNESIYLDVFAGSSVVFKENIIDLGSVLPALLSISCIKFDYKKTDFAHKNFPDSPQVGVIAEEVEKVFPELVKRDNEGLLHVNYSQLSTVAIAAVKELSEMVMNSNERISKLEMEINKLKADSKNSGTDNKI